MASLFSTSPITKAEERPSSENATSGDTLNNGFEVVASDYMPNTDVEPNYQRRPYSSKPYFPASTALPSGSANGLQRVSFHQSDEWLTPTLDVPGLSMNRFQVYGHSPVSDAPSYDGYERMPLNHHTPPPPPPPPHNGLNMHSYGVASNNGGGGNASSNHGSAAGGMNPYTYRGPNADYSSRKQNRLHQDFKALPKEERQRLVEREAATSDLLARTVHLRFLPLTMLQSELADICSECGEYLRVRICGNSTNNQNWIYGFVEFATTSGAEAMMRRSGMELSNGPGRPPLRLKCNCAKQPIVDRVFHDADPATGNPCIFGLGNFAKRSLGDALESYYNLKEKEAQQLTDLPDTPSSTLLQLSPGTAARPPMRLSPHARAFQPSATAMLGAEFLPGVQNATGSTPNSSHWTSPALSAAAMKKAGSDSGSNDSATGVTPTAVNRYRAVSSSAGTTPRATTFTPPQGYSAFDNISAVKVSAAPRFAGATNSVSDRMLSPDGVGATAGAAGGYAGSGFLLPPSKHNATANTSAAAGLSTRSPTTSDMAGSELSLALQNMMLSRAATDGEEVLERGQALTLRAIGQAHNFLNSQQGFYDAMGTLRSLIELLDCHAAVTGGAAATAAGDHTADLPQRATQLRLLANLMMALLYMMKRNLSEALPYIHAVVMSCNEIPVVCLWKATGQKVSHVSNSDRSSSSGGEKSNAVTAPQKTSPHLYKGLAVGDDIHDTTDHPSGYDCFGGPADFLEAVLESIRDDEEAEEEAERKSAAGANSVNGDTASTSSAELQAMLRRDQAFHRYVLNVLVAIGLSMEEVQPVITRSTYSLAAGRARDVLNVACEDLDECLETTEANPHLSDRLYAPPLNSSSKRDITFFPRLFFTSAESMRQSVAGSADKELFWKCLPPKQCVQCYVE